MGPHRGLQSYQNRLFGPDWKTAAEYYLRELSHGLLRLACLSAGTTLSSFAKPLRYLELGFGQRHRRRRDGDFEVRF